MLTIEESTAKETIDRTTIELDSEPKNELKVISVESDTIEAGGYHDHVQAAEASPFMGMDDHLQRINMPISGLNSASDTELCMYRTLITAIPSMTPTLTELADSFAVHYELFKQGYESCGGPISRINVISGH